MNLLLRVLSGAVLLGIAVAALWVGTAPVALLVAGGSLAAAWEFHGLAARLGAAPPGWLLYPLTAWLALRAVFPAGYTGADWALYAAVVLGLTGVVALRQDMQRWAMAVGGACWLGLSLGTYLLLYRWSLADPDHLGLRLVALALSGVIAGDIAAYAAGSLIGRRPFFPAISPHKTVEGSVAGLLASDAATAVVGAAAGVLSWWQGAVLGVLVAVAAQAGDLAESALKRRAGVKDSSHLIPGHGGLLDRVDSLILAAPVVYCYLKLIAL
ncbi:MAG: phosphatidate cytidylyltransferase [Candidatus Dormibacteraeota bacterium]|nr:phosphatidate cytidylyltransferase [Candidatus Dormibacteraeota bacterium]